MLVIAVSVTVRGYFVHVEPDTVDFEFKKIVKVVPATVPPFIRFF